MYKVHKNHKKVVLNQLDDLVQHMGAATTKNANLDGEALDYLTTAFTRAKNNIKEFKTIGLYIKKIYFSTRYI